MDRLVELAAAVAARARFRPHKVVAYLSITRRDTTSMLAAGKLTPDAAYKVE